MHSSKSNSLQYFLLLGSFLLQAIHVSTTSDAPTSSIYAETSTTSETVLPVYTIQNYTISTGHGPVVMSTTASGIVVDTSTAPIPTMSVSKTGSPTATSSTSASLTEGLGSSSEGQRLGDGGFSRLMRAGSLLGFVAVTMGLL